MLTKLKEYKEIITLIVFFLGGFFWLENQFPKKADLKNESESIKKNLNLQIKSLDCLLEKYMILTQLQIRGQEREKQIQDFNQQIETAYNIIAKEGESGLSPSIKRNLEELEKKRQEEEADFKKINQEMDKIRNELERNVCGKVTP